MKVAPPKTPQEVRDLMCSDISLAKDRHLLGVILALGAAGRRRGRPRKSRSSLELAEALLEATGGGWVQLVDTTHADALDLSSFGIGVSIGARLIAGIELSHRWRRGFKDGGDGGMRSGDESELQKGVFQRRGIPSEAELMAVILGASAPDMETARGLVAALGSPRELVASLTLDVFESFRKDAVFHLRLSGSDVEVEFASICRLVAAVELAHRYHARKGPKLPRLRVGAFGLKSPVLVELLSPTGSVDPELRNATIDVLRSHPELAADFARLDRLASDAATSDYRRAIELSLTFELLRKPRAWVHPSEVLGEKVPYEALLAIAQARIERSSKPPTRLVRIKELLEHASQELPTEPIESFAEALARLNLERAVAERAIEEARCRYLEIVTHREQAGAV